MYLFKPRKQFTCMMGGFSLMNKYKVFHRTIRNTKSVFLLVVVSILMQACIEQRPPLDSQNPGVLPGGYFVSLNNKNVVLDQGAQADGILVKFANNTSSRTRTRSIQSAGLRENARFRLVPGLTLADVRPGFTLNQTLNALSRDPSVAFAEPNYIVTIDALPDDPRFNQQYGLNNTGQSGGVVDADIDAPEAWDIQTGNNVIVAVIDTGVDYNHPDLVNNMWQNPGEIPGNRIDDDGNGFVDDVRGWDFAQNTNDPMDPNRHGTHVAGVIAAQGNNGIGVTGINWSARIMPLKFMDNQGVGTTASAIRAIEYAVANGAKVSNNSWGGGNFSQALFDAIQAANRAGHMFIAASGNDGVSNERTPHYPSSFDLPNIISVGASDQSDLIATFSNFGVTSVDLLAPGASILSTVINNGYASLSGTSMATPFVSGVASLLFAHNADLTVSGVRNAILDNVDRIPALNRVVASGGRLNVFNAINSIQQGPPVTSPNPGPGTPPANPPVPQPDVVTVSPNNAEVPIGGSFSFTASGGQGPYTWSVANTTIGTIDSVSGVFQALTIGSTNVIATDSGGLESAPITVSVTNIVITPANVNTLQLTEVRTFTVNGGQGPFTWTASNSAIVNIVAEGTQQESVTVTPNAQGSFNLSVADNSGNSTNTRISVVITPMALDPVTSTINIGSQLQLNASGGTSPYTWSSSNTGVATVDGGGLVTGVGAGSVTISATDNLGVAQTASITVVSAAPALTLTAPLSNVNVGATLQFTATGGVPPYSWSLGGSVLASISSSGLLRAAGAGSLTVTVSDSGNNTATFNITINPAPTPPPGPAPTPGPTPNPGTPAPAPAPAPAPTPGGGGGMHGGMSM